MAVRYSAADKSKSLRRLEKLLAEGNSLHAAASQVASRADQPSVVTLTNWAKAAGLTAAGKNENEVTETAETEDRSENTDETAETNTEARPKRKRRTAKTTEPAEVAVDEATGAEIPEDTEPAADTVVEVAVAETNGVGDSDIVTDVTAPEPADAAPVTEETAVVVHIPASDTLAADANITLEDLIGEIRGLRAALNQATEENRALRNLVGVYVNR